jgi:pimeloyl-ACP methyl ester carboxylesterase
MHTKTFALLAGLVVMSALHASGQSRAAAQGQSTKTTYVTLEPGAPVGADALLMEPATPGPKARFAVITLGLRHPAGPELSHRGYRVLLFDPDRIFGDPVGYEGTAPTISRAVKYLRGVPGVERVVLLGHSGGGALMSFYQNVAENGSKACSGPEKIYPCKGKELDALAKADGIILFDSHIGGGFTQLTYTDPALVDETRATERNPDLDMFDARNGYDAKTSGAAYSADFTRKFFAAQAARNEKVIARAQARLAAMENGQGAFNDDEPYVVPGSRLARLLQPDNRLLVHTRAPHPLLKADGTTVTAIVPSVRPPMGRATRSALGSLAQYTNNTTIRRFLAGNALRTMKDYNMTADAITGVDWASSSTSAVSNVEGVTVPLLIMPMTCHYFLVPDEIIFDHAKSKDKQLVFVEGASHVLTPCRAEYGDTVKRMFDHVDKWLSAPDRFPSPRESANR